MGNPKKTDADMDLHTKQKVAIYDAYLKRYLKIVPSNSSRINLYDPCAGKGKYGEHDGSAIVACKNINYHAAYAPEQGFHIYLNEPNTENRISLQEHCTFPCVDCIDSTDATSFISKHCKQDANGHKLWFIDPYGYTQVNRKSISEIMKLQKSEILLFIPLTFIYRFLQGVSDDNKRLKPIANFLNDYSIAHNEAKNCSSAPEFADLISKKLQTFYGYSWHATMKEGANYYSLVFIGKHHYGLDKFLEARDKILDDLASTQLSLIPMGAERDLLTLIPEKGYINNCEIYHEGLKNGYSTTGNRKHLESLEKRELIHVTPVNGNRRSKSHFFIGNKYYKDQEIRIKISAKHQQCTLPF